MKTRTTPLKFDDLAPDMEILDSDGESIRLSSLWAEKTLVLAFTRHFGCPQCKEMLNQLVQAKPKLEKAGFAMAVVTQGRPEETAAFGRQYAPGIPCLSDPSRKAFRAFGLGRGSLTQTVLSRRVWRENKRVEKEKGWKPELPPAGQDAMQMSGVFIIGKDGRIRLPYYYDNIADHASIELLLKGFMGMEWEKPLRSPITPKESTP